MEEKEDKIKELIEKYKIDIEKLKKEQEKLAKNISIEDSMDFSLAERIAGIENIFFKNKIISAIVVLDENFQVLEQEYFSDKISFPYIPGFRAYRELPCMIQVFNKLDEKPDFVFVKGHGILHPRGLGLASHFSLSVDVPTIGVADFLLLGDVRNDNIWIARKIAGKVVQTKEGAKPLYVSPGNKISVDTSLEIVKKFIKDPHKLPEPLRLAKRYAKEIMKEIFKVQKCF